MGGLLGIILGILIGNLVSVITGNPFVVPWLWILSGVLLCLVVGLLSGFLPALKASKVDPITSLRYE
jgi:putative ABC transport system permease protein